MTERDPVKAVDECLAAMRADIRDLRRLLEQAPASELDWLLEIFSPEVLGDDDDLESLTVEVDAT